METARLFFLLDRYVKDDITNAEIKELEAFLSDKNLQKEAKKYLRQQYEASAKFPDFSTDTTFLENGRHVGQRKTSRKSMKVSYYKYAAAIVVLLGLANLIRLYNESSDGTTINDHPQEVTLTMEDGSKKNLSSNDSIIKIKNGLRATVNQGILKYAQDENKVVSSTYNTLKVPYGKNFSVQLSDGTQVHMNAGSSLKYPISFSGSEKREVFLKGEAYFDVTKDPDKRFIVSTENLSVAVLGTRFNVSAYPEEDAVKTTLEEGSVRVGSVNGDIDNMVHLIPNEQAVWNVADKTITKNKVNAEDFIAWTKGDMVFKKETFWHIQNRLERRFDVTIKNLNTNLKNKRITASFSNKNLTQILKYLQTLEDFEYTMKNAEIIIE